MELKKGDKLSVPLGNDEYDVFFFLQWDGDWLKGIDEEGILVMYRYCEGIQKMSIHHSKEETGLVSSVYMYEVGDTIEYESTVMNLPSIRIGKVTDRRIGNKGIDYFIDNHWIHENMIIRKYPM